MAERSRREWMVKVKERGHRVGDLTKMEGRE